MTTSSGGESVYYSAELYLDHAAETAIRAIQDQIDRRLARTRESGSRPHLTLAVGERLPGENGTDLLAGIAGRMPGEQILFSNVGLFLGEAIVLFLAPVVTGSLLDFQRQVHERLGGVSPASRDFCRPGRWVPHCTLALNLDREGLAVALDIAATHPLPITAQAAGIGVRRYLAAR